MIEAFATQLRAFFFACCHCAQLGWQEVGVAAGQQGAGRIMRRGRGLNFATRAAQVWFEMKSCLCVKS